MPIFLQDGTSSHSGQISVALAQALLSEWSISKGIQCPWVDIRSGDLMII